MSSNLCTPTGWSTRQPELLCCTTTRHIGNLSYHVGDDVLAVTERRQRLAKQAGFSLDRLVAAQQVHGSSIHLVTSAEASRGARDWHTALPETDGLITAEPNLPLLILTADCAAITFYDPIQRVIGNVHAGWRGVVTGISFTMVTLLQKHFNSKPQDLLVSLSPMIHACCYEVGADVKNAFNQSFSPAEIDTLFQPSQRPDHFKLDVPKAISTQLVAAGVTSDNIVIAPECTSSQVENFFSHRKEQGRTGRMGTIIMMRS